MKIVIVFFLILLQSKSILAQFIFQGKIIDKDGNGIPFVSIHRNQGSGVLANQFGEFQFQSSSSEEKVRITHVSYNDSTLILSADREVKVQLKDLIKILPEATISLRGQRIVETLYQKLKSQSVDYSATGFYRQVTTMDNEIMDIMESYHEIAANTKSCIERYKMINGRYGESVIEGFKFPKFQNLKNVVFVSKIMMKGDEAREDMIHYPLMPELGKYYNFLIEEEYINDNNESIVKIFCVPNRREGSFEGYLTINVNKNILLEMEGTILDFIRAFFSYDSENQTWENMSLKIKYQFNPHNGLINVLNTSINSNVFFKKYDFSKKFVFNGVLLLTNYELNKKIRGKKSSPKTDDYKEIKKAKYDPEFWRMNNPIKYSFEENKSIEQYEKGRFFGNYFEQAPK